MSILGDLAGKVALVTGAGSPTGIGFATAVVLGELGASVVVTSTTARIQDRVLELTDRGINAVGVVADLTLDQEVRRLRELSSDVYGGVDIVVNNAGMTSVERGSDAVGAIESLSLTDWHLGLTRNLDTAFLVCREFLPEMKEGGWGRVVMVASTTGPVNAMAGHTVYATAKAAMVGLTRSLALEVSSMGITVNAVAPGWIATGSASDDELRYGSASPIGRSGSPQEVASVIGSLCLPGLSYVTGQVIVIDGANSILEARTN
ncbi:SDR family NAD(P)-dependent oxidoreductase [Ferrimicrobium sp.]|uniref:SDR family NAD(P)-dependent oxidoreductase n=1 Tax=Ferrimicrobium sp. TaxID=2926050 RepID=UPI002626FD01|nr:SDR family NAD(P)-dependent oxidoreductase [Ferrimicrobium sp.]